jgi:uncharacterized protein YndB with AHSA1/START domain
MGSKVMMEGGRLEIHHSLNLPRHEAFTWWSEARKLEQWSGCAGATRCAVTMDFRVGGSFEQSMEIAGRGSFSFRGVYDEIVVPERIAWMAYFGAMSTRVTVRFIDCGEQTEVVLVQEGFPTEESLKTIRQGTLESFDSLDAVLGSQSRLVEAAR